MMMLLTQSSQNNKKHSVKLFSRSFERKTFFIYIIYLFMDTITIDNLEKKAFQSFVFIQRTKSEESVVKFE